MVAYYLEAFNLATTGRFTCLGVYDVADPSEGARTSGLVALKRRKVTYGLPYLHPLPSTSISSPAFTMDIAIRQDRQAIGLMKAKEEPTPSTAGCASASSTIARSTPRVCSGGGMC